jgi:N-acyl-phosphatidylethanolamine-hydrolysing phospholipase D
VARFKNLDPFGKKGFGDILQWRVFDTVAGRRRADRDDDYDTPRVFNDGTPIHVPDPHLCWIGHSTFLVRLGGLCIATDPVWSDSVGPGASRNVPPGVLIPRIPPVDVVTVSHAHYDHLDLPSLREIDAHTRRLRGKDRGATFLVPTGVGGYLRGRAFEKVIELGWWEHHDVQGPRGTVRFTLVPQQHWSMRMPWDRDATLWGGWVMKSAEGTAYHAGDTGYFSHFGEIGERCGPIDWAMLPIGAYDPQWMMKPQHMGPEEAGRAFLELRARIFVCMHWGTFKLTDEPLGEPVQRVQAWWDAEGPGKQARDRLWTMKIGETRALVK